MTKYDKDALDWEYVDRVLAGGPQSIPQTVDTIEAWRQLAVAATNLGIHSNQGNQIASLLVREVNFDLAYGGPLARLDEDGEPLSDEEINEICRAFGYAEIAGD